jgi:hypothetical protein
MSASEFPESERNDPADESGKNEAEDDCGTGQFDGRCGSEKESCSDRAANRDHSHLTGTELVAKAGFGV